jgi:hypothetical protein
MFEREGPIMLLILLLPVFLLLVVLGARSCWR